MNCQICGIEISINHNNFNYCPKHCKLFEESKGCKEEIFKIIKRDFEEIISCEETIKWVNACLLNRNSSEREKELKEQKLRCEELITKLTCNIKNYIKDCIPTYKV